MRSARRLPELVRVEHLVVVHQPALVRGKTEVERLVVMRRSAGRRFRMPPLHDVGAGELAVVGALHGVALGERHRALFDRELMAEFEVRIRGDDRVLVGGGRRGCADCRSDALHRVERRGMRLDDRLEQLKDRKSVV